MTEQNLSYPFGSADVQSFTPAASVTLTIKNQLTIANADSAMAAGMTINMSAQQGLKAGAMVFLRAASDGTARTITPGTGVTGTTEAGVISKTKVLEFVYNGSTFILINARQID